MTPETVPSGCVDESTLVRFFAGDLPMDRLTAVEFHLDACQDCARLIEAAAPLLAGVSGPGRLLALPAEVEPGQLVAGRYRIEGLIGQGATGYVLRARDELAGVPVAVKLLRSERAAQPALMQLFTRELRVARALNHPHVCRVFDLQTSGEDRFLVMELAEGSLRDELRSGGTAERTLDQRLSDGEAIAGGLGAIHDAGIIHRDVKPENVLRLGDGRLVLSDFGLATLTPLGSATRYVGTPLYMAPEVAAGEPATRASDLYSLGIVLHELFFGRRPEWHASNGRRVRKDPPRQHGVRGVLGLQGLKERAIARLAGDCLEELPERRPADARVVLRRLAAIRQGRRLSMPMAASCNRRSYLALSAAMLVAGGGVAFVGKKRSRRRKPPVAAGRLDPLPRALLFEGAWRASFTNTDVGLAVVNRSPGTGFDLVDLKQKTRQQISQGGKDATISPDGSLIAFVTEPIEGAVGREELWLMKRDDHQIGRVSDMGRGAYPSWSRDGRNLFYYDPQSRTVMYLDTQNYSRQPWVWFGRSPGIYPSVSPDRRLMAFGVRDRLIIRDREDGGFEQQWVTPGRRGMLTSWSPDSRLLALAGFRDDKLGVWVLDLVQGRFVRLSAEPSGRPAWTADGKLLTFDTKFGTPASIWSVPTDDILWKVPDGLTADEFTRFCRDLPDLNG
jgi:hypothetical protein